MHQLGTSSPRLYPERVAISFWASQGDLSTSSASPGFPVISLFLQKHSEHLPLALYCSGSYRHEDESATAPSLKERAVQWGRLMYNPGIELPCAKRWDVCARGRNSMEVRATVSAWEVRHTGEGVFGTLKSHPHPSLNISSVLFRVYSGGWKSAGSPPGPFWSRNTCSVFWWQTAAQGFRHQSSYQIVSVWNLSSVLWSLGYKSYLWNVARFEPKTAPKNKGLLKQRRSWRDMLLYEVVCSFFQIVCLFFQVWILLQWVLCWIYCSYL